MSYYKTVLGYLLFLVTAFVVLFFPYLQRGQGEEAEEATLDILTYSSFIRPWGPGPALAKKFEAISGTPVRWIDGGNAGLILERLRFKNRLDRSDVVLGFDQFFLLEARKITNWKDVSSVYSGVEKSMLPDGATVRDFFAFDWGALTFVYRDGEVRPPASLEDLLNSEYAKKLILQDPRMSSPGLQFLFWSLQVFGEEQGMQYLKSLRKSIQVLAPSWSASYSLFQVKPGTLVFSYFTSPLYHEVQETRFDYRAAVFKEPHPVQIEYAGIPETCIQCDKAMEFLKFLASEDAQTILMEKNYMFPMNTAAMTRAGRTLPKDLQFASPVESRSLVRDRRKWVDQWKRLFY